MPHTLSRRQLFRRFLLKNINPVDPLFEKYRRKVYTGRKYAPADLTVKSALRVGAVTTGLSAYVGPWTKNEALHLLKRTHFGYQFADVAAMVSLGMNGAVDSLLNFTNLPPSPPVNNYQNSVPDEGGVLYGADWTTNAFNPASLGTNSNGQRLRSLNAWSIGVGLTQNRNIREKMAWFWYHFIPIDFNSVNGSGASSNSARICYDYMKMLRENASGNFKSIIRNIATQPAMMYYLNNQVNTKTAPDENFAREIMELFTLGKDPLSQYTEADVVQAAKVLTGWRVLNSTSYPTTTSFVLSNHDTSNKTFSEFFNNTIINSKGDLELNAFIDMIFSKSQVVSEYICRRLYRYFVYYDIDSNIETNVIKPLAELFVASNWDMVPVLTKLFKSEHFYDMANRGVCIKSPFDLVLGTLRTFNINYVISDPTNHEAQYSLWRYFGANHLDTMEQNMGYIPNVSGWSAYYQNPSFHEYWINSNTIQKRYNFINIIFNGFSPTYNGLKLKIEVDVIAWVSQFLPAIIFNPDDLVNECVKYLLPVDISAALKETLKVQNLLSNQTDNSYWTTAWANYTSNTTNTTYTSTVKSRLKGLLVSIVQLAEYQLM